MIKKYENYKESGDQWLEEIPENWGVSSLKHHLEISGGYAFKSKDYIDKGGVPILRIGDIKPIVDSYYSKRVPYERIKGLESFRAKKDDILVAMTGATIGKNGVYKSDEEAYVNQRVGLLRSKNNLSQPYLKYFIDTEFFKEFIKLECSGSAQENISATDIANLKIAIPTIEEQTKIAKYLDHQTGLIDNIIEKKQRLIEKLKEQRQAIINEAVTKGLNPDAAMKDSGVEWLGEIPEHWEVVKTKHITDLITDGAHISPDTSKEDYPFISTVDLNKGEINWNNCLKTSSENYFYLKQNGCQPKVGDVLYSKDGTIGKTTVIEEEREFVVASSLIISRPDQKKVLPAYLEYILRSHIATFQIDQLLSGVALRRVSLKKFSNLIFPVPSLDEQLNFLISQNRLRVSYLKSLDEIENSIKKLRFYRKSLISEAVTGKIDVREWEPKVKETA